MGLREEIKQGKPFNSAEEEAYLNILRTHQHLSAGGNTFLRRHGITETQYNVLRILNGAPEGTLPSLEIARRMVTRVPDITRLIDRMEAAALVRRRPCPKDRRVVHIQLTDAGRSLTLALWEPLLGLHHEQLGHLEPAELAELNRLLEKVRHCPAPAGAAEQPSSTT